MVRFFPDEEQGGVSFELARENLEKTYLLIGLPGH
jgi:hypothetical protein